MNDPILFYGTDGKGPLVDELLLDEFEGAACDVEPAPDGSLIYDEIAYRGDHPNRSYGWDHRKEYQIPLFEAEMGKRNAPMLVEWWVREDLPAEWPRLIEAAMDKPRVKGGDTLRKILENIGVDTYDNPAQYSHQTVVHHKPEDTYLVGALNAYHHFSNPVDQLLLELRPDLPPSPIQNEIVLETHMPRGNRSEEEFGCGAAYAGVLGHYLVDILRNHEKLDNPAIRLS